jgi:hypothetical protein
MTLALKGRGGSRRGEPHVAVADSNGQTGHLSASLTAMYLVSVDGLRAYTQWTTE